jgi:hypothetical protein
MSKPKEEVAPVTISFEVPAHCLPSFRSAIEELSNLIGTRLESSRRFGEEDALTYAAVGVGALRGAVGAKSTRLNPHYVWGLELEKKADNVI